MTRTATLPTRRHSSIATTSSSIIHEDDDDNRYQTWRGRGFIRSTPYPWPGQGQQLIPPSHDDDDNDSDIFYDAHTSLSPANNNNNNNQPRHHQHRQPIPTLLIHQPIQNINDDRHRDDTIIASPYRHHPQPHPLPHKPSPPPDNNFAHRKQQEWEATVQRQRTKEQHSIGRSTSLSTAPPHSLPPPFPHPQLPIATPATWIMPMPIPQITHQPHYNTQEEMDRWRPFLSSAQLASSRPPPPQQQQQQLGTDHRIPLCSHTLQGVIPQNTPPTASASAPTPAGSSGSRNDLASAIDAWRSTVANTPSRSILDPQRPSPRRQQRPPADTQNQSTSRHSRHRSEGGITLQQQQQIQQLQLQQYVMGMVVGAGGSLRGHPGPHQPPPSAGVGLGIL
ncbi:hypothetical protein CF326_g8275 [Tilletia indica]|nr:hypothetical protein CF326_g8275 [Tilletia indica]